MFSHALRRVLWFQVYFIWLRSERKTGEMATQASTEDKPHRESDMTSVICHRKENLLYNMYTKSKLSAVIKSIAFVKNDYSFNLFLCRGVVNGAILMT